jgi:hypothetical protein
MECAIKHNSTMDSKALSLYRTTEYLNESIRSLVGTLKCQYTSKSEIIISCEINTNNDSDNY